MTDGITCRVEINQEETRGGRRRENTSFLKYLVFPTVVNIEGDGKRSGLRSPDYLGSTRLMRLVVEVRSKVPKGPEEGVQVGGL